MMIYIRNIRARMLCDALKHLLSYVAVARAQTL